MTVKKLILKYLEDNKLTEQVDLHLIDEYVFNMGITKKAKREIRRDGVTIEKPTTSGAIVIVKHPAIDVYNTALNQLERIGNRLVISPLARKKILGLTEKTEDDGFNP